VHVGNDVATITVTGVANHEGATISGGAVVVKALMVGANEIPIMVVAEDGVTTATYTVTVIRAASADATLKSLTVSVGALSPAFAANVTEYTVNVGNDVTAITITGEANHAEATVSGNVTNKALTVGANVVSISVVAEDGVATAAYTVTVNRAASADATLKSLTVSVGALLPAFNANVTEYTVNVANDVAVITVVGQANHTEATVEGAITTRALTVGANAIAIAVTAEDRTTVKTYTVTVVRAEPLTNVEIADAPLARAYPNPVDDVLTLEFEAPGAYHLSLADVTGKIVLRQIAESPTIRIDVGNYPAGVYLLTIDDGKRRSVVRIVKN